jgi:thiol-disulfide isomerase/thioredoxin
MKKIILILLVLLGLQSHAQTNLTTAVDFTVTDVHGNTHNLFSILDSEKHVILDFFFTTCPPCISSVPIINQAYTDYGCNMGEIVFLSIDAGDTDAQVLQYENSYGGLLPSVSGINGGGDAVNSIYGIGAYPTVVLIAPDRTVIEQDIYPVTLIPNALSNAGLNMASCDTGSTVSIQEVDLYSRKCLKMFDLLGRELTEIPVGTIYIKNRKLNIRK